MRVIHSVVFADGGLQIVYTKEDGLDEQTGSVEVTTLEASHALIPTELLSDLQESVETIIDEITTARRRPRESFQAPR